MLRLQVVDEPRPVDQHQLAMVRSIRLCLKQDEGSMSDPHAYVYACEPSPNALIPGPIARHVSQAG